MVHPQGECPALMSPKALMKSRATSASGRRRPKTTKAQNFNQGDRVSNFIFVFLQGYCFSLRSRYNFPFSKLGCLSTVRSVERRLRKSKMRGFPEKTREKKKDADGGFFLNWYASFMPSIRIPQIARFVRRHCSNGEHVIFAGTDGQVGGKYWFWSATILQFAGKRLSFARKKSEFRNYEAGMMLVTIFQCNME